MSYMSDKEFKAKMKEIQRDNEGIEKKKARGEERMELLPKRKGPATSKIVVLVVFMLCIQIVLYCESAVSVSRS